ncbi:MAG: hypothetical protein FIB04_08115 [Gammaproteobacteria bacterium]|nr:hypothetical protein [Gammaproteobacteria bacterium]
MKILGIETGERPAGEEPGHLGQLLRRNAELRTVFAREPALQARLEELQQWQSQRLLRSHADLRADPRYRLAVEFFFGELYGGGDPHARDRDVMRVHRVMERLLPREALHALCLAIELEILSQELDADVVRNLPPGPITVETYADGYRGANRRPDRERQIELTGIIGAYLDNVVKKPIIRGLVRLARGPAHAAGFGALQEFLERGLVAFETMHGAGEFLATIRDREVRAMERILARTPDPFQFGERSRRGKD